LLRAEPGNPVLMAYSGASTAMKSGTTMLPWKKMGFAEDGLALIDKALALLTPAHDAPLHRGTPAVLEVKLHAANTFLAVPGFMNRGERGAKLLGEVLASPLLAARHCPSRARCGCAPAGWRRPKTSAGRRAPLATTKVVARTPRRRPPCPGQRCRGWAHEHRKPVVQLRQCTRPTAWAST
jgi:hypothetical protein